jgi:hypothetical protein
MCSSGATYLRVDCCFSQLVPKRTPSTPLHNQCGPGLLTELSNDDGEAQEQNTDIWWN